LQDLAEDERGRVSRFPTITAEHWRTAIRRARAERNEIAEQIKEYMSTQDGWIKMSARPPGEGDLPVWLYTGDCDFVGIESKTMLAEGVGILRTRQREATHWKPAAADIPAPPKEPTQDSKDEHAYCEWYNATQNTRRETPPHAWHAALAWERAEVGKMLPAGSYGLGEAQCALAAIRARCGGGK
jgi:hypothetical protein